MTSYRLTEGACLVLRANDGPWQTVVLATADAEATAAELAPAIDGLDGITATADDDGRLVLTTEDTGETALLEVDLEASTAAAALGLTALGLAPGGGAARGLGPGSATLTGSRPGPYPLPRGVTLTVVVDGKTRNIVFDDEEREQWPATDVAGRINRSLRRKVARVTGDDHVRLTSPTQGTGSSLEITGAAAEPLGFVGDSAHSDPYRSEPARLTCRPAADTAVVENLTAAPIELQLPTGRSVLPARGRLVVSRDTAADGLLRRLEAQGTVRLSPERNS